MNIKNYLLLFLLPCSLLAVFSCRSLVDEEFPDYGQKPVINCILVQGKPLTVHISMTGKLDSTLLTLENDAKVDLWVDSVFVERLERQDDGVYVSTRLVQPLVEYSCEIAIPGYQTVYCRETLPKPAVVEKIEHINIAGRDGEGTTFPAIKLTFKNYPNETRYYEISIRQLLRYRDWDSKEEYYEEEQVYIPLINDPVLLNEGLPLMLFSNEIITDSLYTMVLNYTTGASYGVSGSYVTMLSPLIIELRSLTYDYYRYRKQLYLYSAGRSADGLVTPVTASPVYSNIENASGIFSGYSFVKTDTITPPPYEF